MYLKKAHIHFVGIGGIGMSGIAKILRYQGYTISGCDLDIHKENVADLISLGCSIYEGNDTPSCHDPSIDILVYSTAINKNSNEIRLAQSRRIPTIRRALMLAELMRTKYGIAITGAHGKTTTTSLISHILIEACFDPTVIIGGHLKNISTNARYGGGDFLVAEADESDRSLLYLHATLALITNIDLEHLETYTDIDDIKQTFAQFIKNIPFYGKAFVCTDNAHIRSMLPIEHVKTVTYAIDHDADYQAIDIKLDNDQSSFKVYHATNNTVLGHITFSMLGKHNVSNCLGAIALALDLGIPFHTIQQALKTFKGVDRRFCYRGTYRGAELFDDYGHHPEEIRRTLEIAQKRPHKKLTVVFQPHRYTRTHHLWEEFISAFTQSSIDHLILTDIHEASEAPIPNVTSQNLARAIQASKPELKVTYAKYDPNFDTIIKVLEESVGADDLLLLQGAGKIYSLLQKIT